MSATVQFQITIFRPSVSLSLQYPLGWGNEVEVEVIWRSMMPNGAAEGHAVHTLSLLTIATL